VIVFFTMILLDDVIQVSSNNGTRSRPLGNETAISEPCEQIESWGRTRQRFGCFHVRRNRMLENLRKNSSLSTLKRRHESPVLLPPLLHTDGFEHLCSARESNDPAPLPDGQRGEEYWNESVSSPRKSVRRMSYHLKQKSSVAPLMQELSRLRALHRESAQHEMGGMRSRGSDSPPVASPGHRQ
jgi:hypothetical protein